MKPSSSLCIYLVACAITLLIELACSFAVSTNASWNRSSVFNVVFRLSKTFFYHLIVILEFFIQPNINRLLLSANFYWCKNNGPRTMEDRSFNRMLMYVHYRWNQILVIHKDRENNWYLGSNKSSYSFLAGLLKFTSNQNFIKYVICLDDQQRLWENDSRKKHKRNILGAIIITLWKLKIKSSSQTWNVEKEKEWVIKSE